jgi:PBSX family phage portal protein
MAAQTKKDTHVSKRNKEMSELSQEDLRYAFSTYMTSKEDKEKVLGKALGTRQVSEETVMDSIFKKEKDLVKHPYDPTKLYRVYEESSILPQCVDAMVKNIDGFGHALAYTGKSGKESSPAALKEKKDFEAFLSKSNEKESFITIRKEMRTDLEVTGNGYLEIIRDRAGNISLIYHADARYIFAQRIQAKRIEITVQLFRNGKYRDVKVQKRFRRYLMVVSSAKTITRWFKEFGDPRNMDAITGKYEDELESGEKIEEYASEIYHFKIGNGTYGIPRWIGNVLTVKGIRSSDFVNWDLFENQVVPPLTVLVSGGKLGKESLQDLTNIFQKKKGLENFNKLLLLEAESGGQISDKSQVKIDLKEMSTARKEDAMFTMYTDKGEHRIRGSFRLAPLYLGRADSYSKSTADSSKLVSEEQVFVPERELFDEIANNELFSGFKLKFWRFKSKGPRLVSGPDVVKGFETFGKQGVFTINDGIRLANTLLGTDLAVYTEPWANLPISLVAELVKNGSVQIGEYVAVPPVKPAPEGDDE